MSETKEIQKIQTSPTVEQIMMAAVEKGDVNIEVLERLMDLKERDDKSKAEKAFNEAFTQFQKECPVIPKTVKGSETKGGTLAFKYAPLDVIEGFIKTPLNNNGLTYSWDSSKKDTLRSTVCTITHTLGHKKSAQFESVIDPGTSLMNPLQREGSTIGYGKRNSLVLVLGLIMVGEDDDGNAGGNDDGIIKPETAKKIQAELNKAQDPPLAWESIRGEIEKVEEIPVTKVKAIADSIVEYLKNENG